MKQKMILRSLSMVMAAVMTLILIPAAVPAQNVSAAKKITVCDLICDNTVAECEIIELQKARLAGLVPDELCGDVNRKITVEEFKLLLKALMEYENETQPEGFKGWLNEKEEGYLTRKDAANSFIQQYHFALNREYDINLAASMMNSSLFSAVAECLDPEFGGGSKEGFDEYNFYIFFIGNFDQYSGAPLMDRDLNGYLRLNDPMTVKEAIQLVYRYSNSHTKENSEYISLKKAAAQKLVLSDEEMHAAELIPEPTYEKLPAYQGAWYLPVIGRADIVFEDDFSMISDMGFNYLRYTISSWQFLNQKGEIQKSALEALDNAIHYAIKYGFHINLDLDLDIGGESPVRPLFLMRDGVKTPVEGGIAGFGNSTFTAQQYRNYYCNIWKTIAERYSNVPNSILSFQLFTEEPVDDELSGFQDDYLSEGMYTEFVYILADAIWEKDDDRLISTGAAFYDVNPCVALAEEGIKRNLSSGGKERRILQNFHMFLPDYSWTNGFYGEMPSANINPDYIPNNIFSENSITVKAPSGGFGAGTTIKIRDNNRNIDKLCLTSYKNGSVVETPSGKAGVGNKYVTYTLSKDADTIILTNKGTNSPMTDNYLYYIWITYPEKADKKIPIFGYFREDSGDTYGSGGYEEYTERNANGLMSYEEIAYSTVLGFTDRKTTFVTVGGDSMRLQEKKAQKEGKTVSYAYADTVIKIKDGNDYADYTSEFKDYTGQDPITYRCNDDDLLGVFIDNWKEFCEKYHTVPIQHEMGPNNGSRKEVLYAYSERWLDTFEKAGWPWGGIAHPNANGALYDDYIWKGDYVNYDFHRTDATQLKIYQEHMKKFDIDDIGVLYYTGKEQKPDLTVKYKGTKLIPGTDYEVSYHDMTEPGTATAVVTGKGKYEGIFSVQRYFIVKDSIKKVSSGKKEPDWNNAKQTVSIGTDGKITLVFEYKDVKGVVVKETFVSDKKGLALKKIKTKSTDISVPGELTIDGNSYKVISICKKVFGKNKKVKTISIPSSIKTVKKNAFKGAKKLKTINVRAASEKDFARIEALITASGISSKIRIEH